MQIDVELEGIEKVRKIPGFHAESLKGDRARPRSIRLSKAYGAITTYKIASNLIGDKNYLES